MTERKRNLASAPQRGDSKRPTTLQHHTTHVPSYPSNTKHEKPSSFPPSERNQLRLLDLLNSSFLHPLPIPYLTTRHSGERLQPSRNLMLRRGGERRRFVVPCWLLLLLLLGMLLSGLERLGVR